MNDRGSVPGPQKPGWGYGVYEPPRTASAMPGVVLWYRVYALATAHFYVAASARLYVTHMHHGGVSSDALVFVLAGGGALLHAAAAFLPLSPRGWWVGLAVIGLGLVFGLFPAAIALLVYWNKPVTKAAFGRF